MTQLNLQPLRPGRGCLGPASHGGRVRENSMETAEGRPQQSLPSLKPNQPIRAQAQGWNCGCEVGDLVGVDLTLPPQHLQNNSNSNDSNR